VEGRGGWASVDSSATYSKRGPKREPSLHDGPPPTTLLLLLQLTTTATFNFVNFSASMFIFPKAFMIFPTKKLPHLPPVDA